MKKVRKGATQIIWGKRVPGRRHIGGNELTGEWLWHVGQTEKGPERWSRGKCNSS